MLCYASTFYKIMIYYFLNGGMDYVRCDCNGYGWYFIGSGSLTLAHSQNSQMSFIYGFFFVKFLFYTVVCVVIVI